MHGPPDPGIPALLLAVAQRFGFVAVDTSGAVGCIDGHKLTVEGTGPATVAWLALPQAEDPLDLAPRFLTREAYDGLRQGSLDKAGRLVLKGRVFRLVDCWDGARLIATLSPL